MAFGLVIRIAKDVQTCITRGGISRETEKGTSRNPPPFSDRVGPDSKPNTCRWSHWMGGVFIAPMVPRCGKLLVLVQTPQMGRFCNCLLGPS